MALAGIKARFDLQVRSPSAIADDVWAMTRGEEGGNASTLQADSEVTLSPIARRHACASYRSEVSITGRLGRFALGMMKKKAQSLGDEFAANLRAQARRAGGAAHGRAPRRRAADIAAPRVPWWRGAVGVAVRQRLRAASHGIEADTCAALQGMLGRAPWTRPSALLARRPRGQAARRRCHAGGDDERARARAARARQPGAHRRSCSGIRGAADGGLRIGAFTRHARNRRLRRCCSARPPSCGRPPRKIANATVRNMGTIGGSISFADPGLDYPPALVAAGASIEIAGAAGRRESSARDVLRRLVHDRARARRDSSPRCSCASRASRGAAYVQARPRRRRLRDRVGRGVLHRADEPVRAAIGACGPTPLRRRRRRRAAVRATAATPPSRSAGALLEPAPIRSTTCAAAPTTGAC